MGDWLPKPTVATDGSLLVTLEELERQHIQHVIELANWQVRGARGAAEILGLKPTDARIAEEATGDRPEQ